MATANLEIELTQGSQNVSANTTSVGWAVYNTSTHAVNANMTGSCVVNGVNVWSYAGNPGFIDAGARKKMASGTLTVAHNSDGTKTVSASAALKTNTQGSSWSFNASKTASKALTKIPRKSSPTVSGSVYLENSIIIYTNRKSSSFTHTISYTFGSESGTIAVKTSSDSVSWVPPLGFAYQIPNASEGYGNIIVETFSGNQSLGSNNVQFKAKVPNDIVPTLESATIQDTSNVFSVTGAYLSGISKFKADYTGEAGAYGSTIKTYTLSIGAKSVNGKDAELLSSENGVLPVVAKVTDSRSRTASVSIPAVSVAAYKIPVINLRVFRANSSNQESVIGTSIGAVGTVEVDSLAGYAYENLISFKIAIVSEDTSETIVYDGSGLTGPIRPIIGPFAVDEISADSIVRVRTYLSDFMSTSVSEHTLPLGDVAFSVGKRGIGVGKVYESGLLDIAPGIVNIAGDAYTTDDIKDALSEKTVFAVGSEEVNSTTSFAQSPDITLPFTITENSFIDTRPKISSSGIISISSPVDYTVGGNTFAIRHRTVSGTYSNYTIQWVAFQ